ncbi:MAG: homoserine O-acetyltransferase, partial [bacterium]
CKGTTGPGSINPETGKPYALDFPVITVEDLVKVEKKLIDYLGIEKLYCVSGGSLGGMQALVWAVDYPEMVSSAVLIATAAYTSTQGIAFHKVGRNAIMSDQKWNNGNYYDSPGKPEKGLAIARMIGHITYLSDESMRNKFSRTLQNKKNFGFDMSDDFTVEGYLEYQGEVFVERFDANSYLYITKTMDYFDIPAKYGSMEKAFNKVCAKILVVSFTSDWLYPTFHSKEIVKALMRNKKDVSFCEIDSPYGHDAFLLESEKLGRIVSSFLMNLKG